MRKYAQFGARHAANHAANAMGGHCSPWIGEQFTHLLCIARLVRQVFGKPLHHLFMAATARVASIAPLCAPLGWVAPKLLAGLGLF
jgi:hypothetical protein